MTHNYFSADAKELIKNGATENLTSQRGEGREKEESVCHRQRGEGREKEESVCHRRRGEGRE